MADLGGFGPRNRIVPSGLPHMTTAPKLADGIEYVLKVAPEVLTRAIWFEPYSLRAAGS